MVLQPAASAATTRGAYLVVAGRCIAETKYLVMLVVSVHVALGSVRRALELKEYEFSTADLCDDPLVCVPLHECIGRTELELAAGSGYRLDDPDYMLDWVSIAVLLVFFVGNVIAIVICILSEAHEEDWRVSDLALCYEINRMYCSSAPLRIMRLASQILIGLLFVGMFVEFEVYDLWELVYASFGAFIFPMIAAVVAVVKMWEPVHSLKDIPFRLFMSRVKSIGFAPDDLLKSAPRVLIEKLSVWARDEELSEMREEAQGLVDA